MNFYNSYDDDDEMKIWKYPPVEGYYIIIT